MVAKKEFVNVLIKGVRFITADYKEDSYNDDDDKNFSRKIQRKRLLVFNLNVDDVPELSLNVDGDEKFISFPKRIDKKVYTTKETNEDYIYLDFSGSVKVLDENTMTRMLDVVIDNSYPNAEYSEADINVSIFYNDEAKKYLVRVNVIRIKKGSVITEINNYTFEDEAEFKTLNSDGEVIETISNTELIEG